MGKYLFWGITIILLLAAVAMSRQAFIARNLRPHINQDQALEIAKKAAVPLEKGLVETRFHDMRTDGTRIPRWDITVRWPDVPTSRKLPEGCGEVSKSIHINAIDGTFTQSEGWIPCEAGMPE